MTRKKTILAIIIPCYNEEEIFLHCLEQIRNVLVSLVDKGKVHPESYLLFVDDGSKDKSWDMIEKAAIENKDVRGLKLSRNKGHQIALCAAFDYALDKCDISISIDADLQDDPLCIEAMIDAYARGNDIVYGVRESRKSDSIFKKRSAELFYKSMALMGVEQVFNHADYRLLSKKALAALTQYEEGSPYLRGLVPLIGFSSSCVFYSRAKRTAGQSKYNLRKMISLALTGITSLTVFPLRLITFIGGFFCLFSILGIFYTIFLKFSGLTVDGWSSTMILFLFFGGVQMLSLGIIGEYIGKIYIECKKRPKYFLDKSTDSDEK